MIVADIGRGPGPLQAASLRAASVGFAVPTPPASPAAPSAAPPAAPLDVILALQEQEANATRDRQARQHGQALLYALAALQRALLGGGGEAAALQRLAALAQSCPAAATPGLAAVIQGLALRARVELARRGL